LCGGSPRYQIYPTSDGRLVACAALEEKFWRSFAAAIGLDQSFAEPAADPAAVKREIARIIGGRPAAHWRPILAAAPVPVAPLFRAPPTGQRSVASLGADNAALLPRRQS
jgi:crotonobetainyl-CoA:carnitine CoA-transferase CaiB-like acyl-CoA transferase